MKTSQQRFSLLMQKLEGIETALADTKKEISNMEGYVVNIHEFAQLLNYRLVFAGQALLGEAPRGFSEKSRQLFNSGRLSKESDAAEPAEPAVSRGPNDGNDANRT